MAYVRWPRRWPRTEELIMCVFGGGEGERRGIYEVNDIMIILMVD